MFNDIDYEQFPHQLSTRKLAEMASELERLIEAKMELKSSLSENSLGKHCNSNFVKINVALFPLFQI